MNYISYGLGKFDVDKFDEIQNVEYRNKPKGGLWASPVSAKRGWKDWCWDCDCILIMNKDIIQIR